VYVCICHAVTDSQIKEFAASNGCNWRKMRDELKTGNDCGSCAIKAKRILTDSCSKSDEAALSADGKSERN
jgi:bacterioferritin-associated ferredoxin